jgi:hypothetical protein
MGRLLSTYRGALRDVWRKERKNMRFHGLGHHDLWSVVARGGALERQRNRAEFMRLRAINRRLRETK